MFELEVINSTQTNPVLTECISIKPVGELSQRSRLFIRLCIVLVSLALIYLLIKILWYIWVGKQG